MIIIAGHFEVRPSSVDEVRSYLPDLEHKTRTEEGCLFYAIALDDQAAASFVFIKKWRDEAALQAHLALPEAQRFIAKLRECITSIQLKIHDVAGERDFEVS